MQVKLYEKPRPASSIRRAFAYKSSDLSLNTAADRQAHHLRLWQEIAQSRLLKNSSTVKKQITPSTLHSTHLGEKDT